jgi:hypothetical protein
MAPCKYCELKDAKDSGYCSFECEEAQKILDLKLIQKQQGREGLK